ncbi:hypothetical protein NPIL_466571 [Nephila pilipes]|uniref:Uncharacterized protein n=1 Tax=Nephila pilipes TaxID=299642 RepID=A0A8X6N558_NEPPI|nr:hypothetical protein NPIL_466571 [Nephila pilipes]
MLLMISSAKCLRWLETKCFLMTGKLKYTRESPSDGYKLQCREESSTYPVRKFSDLTWLKGLFFFKCLPVYPVIQVLRRLVLLAEARKFVKVFDQSSLSTK